MRGFLLRCGGGEESNSVGGDAQRVAEARQLLIVPASLATGVVDFGAGGGCRPGAVTANDQHRSIREQSCSVRVASRGHVVCGGSENAGRWRWRGRIEVAA